MKISKQNRVKTSFTLQMKFFNKKNVVLKSVDYKILSISIPLQSYNYLLELVIFFYYYYLKQCKNWVKKTIKVAIEKGISFSCARSSETITFRLLDRSGRYKYDFA